MDKRYYALIPIVELGDRSVSADDNSRLLTVYSAVTHDPAIDAKAFEMGMDPVVASLMACKLVRAGMNALGAVRKLGLRKPVAAFYQWLKPQACLNRQRLYCDVGSGPTEGGSAELGLALALLMGATDSRDRFILATGRLAPDLASETQHTKARDAKIYPVGSVAEKLRLVAKKAKAGQLPAEIRYFFVPEEMPDNVEIQALVRDLAEAGIRVYPVGWLSEAARVLKVHRTRSLGWDWGLRFFWVVFVVICVGWGGFVWWRDRAIELVFLGESKGPFIACVQNFDIILDTATAHVHETFSVATYQKEWVAPIDSTLGWKLMISGNWLDYWLYDNGFFDGYYVAQVMVSDNSPTQILVPKYNAGEPAKIAPGQVWHGAFSLNEKVELNGLILLAKRSPSFDKLYLRAQLNSYTQEHENQSVTARVDFFNLSAPGSKSFIFKTKIIPNPCL